MKFLHIGDLHIGKRVNEFPMIENQKEILRCILNIARDKKADGIIISGDVYDKSIPSVEAIEVFEEFIEQLVLLKVPAYIVSGNHDSAERLSAFSNLIKKNNIYISKLTAASLNQYRQGMYKYGFFPLFVRLMSEDFILKSKSEVIKTQ